MPVACRQKYTNLEDSMEDSSVEDKNVEVEALPGYKELT